MGVWRTMSGSMRHAETGTASGLTGSSRGLLVVDRSGLAIAALDDTNLRHVDADEIDSIVGGLNPALPGPSPEFPLGAWDRVVAVTPSVLRLEPSGLLAWDESAGSYVALGRLELDVLAATADGVAAQHLCDGRPGTSADALDRTVRHLTAIGLVTVERCAPDGDLEHAPPCQDVVVQPAAAGSDSADPRLFEGLPSSAAGAARVVAFRTAVRGRRRARHLIGAVAATAVARTTDAPTPADMMALSTEPAEAPEVAGGSHQPELVTATSTQYAWADHRVPVFGVYHSPEHNANLGLGMIVGYARVADGGALNTTFDLRRASIDPAPMLAELEATGRPAVVLCSDYMWSLEHNLGVSATVKALSPRSIVVHGGPHAPSYPGDAERFLLEHPEVDVLARGEGELTIAELLAALGTDADPDDLHDRLAEVAGITYRRRTDDGIQVVRTADRPLATEMDRFPSPYLTGEFADVDPARWRSATVETNRGCPYGCTFCDWGQATMSRIRQFSIDRVFAELEWIAARGISEVFLADSNFGIYSRDVDIAHHIADLKARYGAPQQVICSFAKNTVKYTTEIVRIWVEAGICAEGSVALQTTDPVTLQNVERSNIKVEKYDALAEEFRRHRLPIVTDLLMGLPGATVESFKADLQRCLDQDVTPRMMETVLLPNSPMNDPAYSERFRIELDPSNILVSTSSYTREDFEEMKRLRLLFRSFEHFGLMRHLFRWLQHERGIRALDLIHEIDRAITEDAPRYPLLTWVGRYFDLVTAPPGGWPPFYDEVADLLADRYGLHDDPGLDVVLAVQRFLMPARGRVFPATLALDHDYVAWLDDLQSGAGDAPLADYGPGELVVDDPAGICEARIVRNGFSIRREEACDNPFWVLNDWELDSVLARPMATAVPFLSS